MRKSWDCKKSIKTEKFYIKNGKEEKGNIYRACIYIHTDTDMGIGDAVRQTNKQINKKWVTNPDLMWILKEFKER